MRRILLSAAAISSFLVLTSAGCKHDNNNIVTPDTPGNTTGKWTVTMYLDDGRNEASDFSGYSFEFGNSGSMTAEKNGQVTAGSWAENMNDGLQKFRITLNTSDNKLSKLNHNWVIQVKNETEIDLRDDDPSGEELHFTRQ